MESKMECILASIFERFWCIFGAKLGRKNNQKSTEKASKKRCKKEGHQDGQKCDIRSSKSLGRMGVQSQGEIPPYMAGQSSGGDGMRRRASKVF